jgi:hypothetical protein
MANRAITRNGEAFTAETVGTSGTKFKVTHDASGRSLVAGWSASKQKFVCTDDDKQVLSYFVDAAMRKMCNRILAYEDRKELVASFFRATRTRDLRDPVASS